MINQLTKDEAATKDLIQNIFLNIWINRHKLPGIEHPGNWIFKSVYYKTYTWLEQKATRARAIDTLTERAEISNANLDTEAAVSFAATKKAVKEAIANLSPQARKIYMLSREAGMKNAEIAGELNISIQTVKNTLNNASKQIREHLVDKGIHIPLVLLIFWRL